MDLEQLQREAAIASLKAKHKTNHILHLILSVITVGLWLPVWVLVAISNSIERGKVERRADDNTFAQRLGRFVGRATKK
jgi:hypothetical protein